VNADEVFNEVAVAQQPSLFTELEMDLLTLDREQTRKRYTAASLERQVGKRDAILRALAEGHGLLRIAKAFGVSHHLVSALRDTRPELVAIEKKQLSGQIGRILKMSADRFEEALEHRLVPPGQIPVAFGIFADKKAMIDGEAGLVVEHRHRIDASPEGFAARLRAAVDLQSTVSAPIPQQKEVILEADVVADTSGPAGSAAGPVAAAARTRPQVTGGGGAGAAVPADAPMGRLAGGEEQKEVL
jgi:hypothetical protein